MDEIEWDYDDLKKALLDSASDYDRILKSMNANDDITTFTRMGSKQDKAEKPSKE
tara:strand:- start:400 stop:564 length:165 start_codon:yes stop_codon:yes gene_type:complete